MSQPSSSDFSPSSGSPVSSDPSNSDAASAPASELPRRLLSPRERFAPETLDEPETGEPETGEPEEGDNAVVAPQNLAPETVVSARLNEEMARRHLPPRERRKHERARIQREERELKRRAARAQPAHSQPRDGARDSAHARAERDFAVGARETAPLAPSKPRRLAVFLKRVLGLVLLIFVGQLIFAAFTAPQFEIAAVEINGLSATPPDEVQPIARRLIGQNVLRANRARIENAVRRVPTVADAQVVRLMKWPPRVELRITERKPLVKVGAGQNWWIVDESGVAFRRPTRADDALYSIVAPQFAPELRQKLLPKTWQGARALNAALRRDNELVERKGANSEAADQEPFWKLRRIYFDKDGLASLRVTREAHREMLVRLGDDAWPAKLARARDALAYFERTGRRAAELDLVSLERPVWTPIAPQPEAKLVLDAG